MFLKGYIPLPSNLRAPTLARKRGEYLSLVELAFARDRQGIDQQIWHQIEIDVPRTRPGVRLWMQASTQRVRGLHMFVILFLTSLQVESRADTLRMGYTPSGERVCTRDKRPCNPLLSSFSFSIYRQVHRCLQFLSLFDPYPFQTDSDPEQFDTSLLPENVLNAVEADSFWCLSRLLDGIQDNYISAQPGIHRSVKRMSELVARIDGSSNLFLVNILRVNEFNERQHHFTRILGLKMSSLCNLHSVG